MKIKHMYKHLLIKLPMKVQSVHLHVGTAPLALHYLTCTLEICKHMSQGIYTQIAHIKGTIAQKIYFS